MRDVQCGTVEEEGRMTILVTHDGTVILCDPEFGVISKRTRAEAEAELRRRRNAKRRRAA